MGIHTVENRIEVRADEQDVVMVVAEIAQKEELKVVLMLAQFTEEDKSKEGFPFALGGLPITDVPHISLTFKDEEQVDKMISMLETQKEAMREMNEGTGLEKMMEESE